MKNINGEDVIYSIYVLEFKVPKSSRRHIYVGVTTQKNPWVRIRQQISAFKHASSPGIVRCVREQGGEYVRHEIVARTPIERYAAELEMEYIAKYTAMNDVISLNINKGGEFRLKSRTSEHFRQRMSEIQKGSRNSNYGRKGRTSKEKLEFDRQMRAKTAVDVAVMDGRKVSVGN